MCVKRNDVAIGHLAPGINGKLTKTIFYFWSKDQLAKFYVIVYLGKGVKGWRYAHKIFFYIRSPVPLVQFIGTN